MGKWYEENLGFKIIHTHGNDKDGVNFLYDEKSGFLLELFRSPDAGILEFSYMRPITFHLAIDCKDPLALAKQLESHGAKIIEGSHNIDHDSEKILIKDPWGMTLQLINRNKKLIINKIITETEISENLN